MIGTSGRSCLGDFAFYTYHRRLKGTAIPDSDQAMSNQPSFFAKLKRRNVVRMAGLYLVGAWLLVQVAGTVLPMFGAPDWLPRSVVILLAIGFLPALIFSWVFEMTPEGLKCDDEVPIEQSIVPQIAEVYAYRNDKD